MQSTNGSFPISCGAYEAELVPGRRARLVLLASAAAAIVAGTMLIVTLPAVLALKSVLVLLWIAASLAELASFCRGMSRIYRIGIRPDGSIRGYDASGRVHALRLLPGSVVLERVAWLRLGFASGLVYGELLAGSASESDAWRRLQVIWRHHRYAFGRSGRS